MAAAGILGTPSPLGERAGVRGSFAEADAKHSTGFCGTDRLRARRMIGGATRSLPLPLAAWPAGDLGLPGQRSANPGRPLGFDGKPPIRIAFCLIERRETLIEIYLAERYGGAGADHANDCPLRRQDR